MQRGVHTNLIPRGPLEDVCFCTWACDSQKSGPSPRSLYFWVRVTLDPGRRSPPPTPKPLAAQRLRPTGGTTDFWPQSFQATPIGLMLKYRIQPGARWPSAPPRSAAYAPNFKVVPASLLQGAISRALSTRTLFCFCTWTWSSSKISGPNPRSFYFG